MALNSELSSTYMPQTGSTATFRAPTESIAPCYNRLAFARRGGHKSKYGGPDFGPNRMKVAMVTPYWAPVRGGITTFVSELTEALRSLGHDVQVFARQGNGPGATEIGGTGREFARRAAKALGAFRPDVIP